MLVSELMDQARVLLIDTTATYRWAQAELLDYYNDAGSIIVSHKPQANATTSSTIMVSGVKQSLPTGGTALIRINRNMGTDGSTAGKAVTIISQDVIDRTTPTWVTDTASATTDHYMYSTRNPGIFYIYPQSDGTGYLELIYGKAPATVAIGDIASTNVALSDDYLMIMLDYILFRAYSKDSDVPNAAARASAYKASFMEGIGMDTQGELTVAPAAANIPPQGTD